MIKTELINPPGKIIKKYSNEVSIGQINFKNKHSKTPLQPLIEAYLSEDNNKILLSTIVFLDAAISLPSFDIYMNYDFGSIIPCKIYVSYDYKETRAKTFKAYELNFELDSGMIPEKVKISDIKMIMAFLWDSDPIASRGTVTNVQPN